VLAVVRYLAAAYPNREISERTVGVYVIQLVRAQLAADVLLLAALNLVDSSEWLPTVAELTTEARRIEGAREGWYLSANYRLHGHPLPEELCLPSLPLDRIELVWGHELSSGLLLEASYGQD
jgi:hypothetical protein